MAIILNEDLIQFKEIPGYEGYYVSKCGLVASNRRGKWKILKGSVKATGYKEVGIYKGFAARKVLRHARVHALVLEVWDRKKKTGEMCRHLNGCKLDNRIENLRWGTSKENNGDRRLHGTMPIGEIHPGSKLSEDDVLEIRKTYTKGVNQFDPGNTKELALKFGINVSGINKIIHGQTWKHLPIK